MSIEEIFVEDVSYIDIKDAVYTGSVGMPRESSFENKFWKDCNCELYYEQDKKIFKPLKIL